MPDTSSGLASGQEDYALSVCHNRYVPFPILLRWGISGERCDEQPEPVNLIQYALAAMWL
jgi:hypothetical protein